MSSTNIPKVTVLMAVYNGEKYLREAIDSILNQTFKDFEFLIIDDGSTDGSADIIQSYEDKRIRYMRNEKNIGVAASSNRGLCQARGEYIARMDCDDISLPERLEKQVKFMDDHPEVGVCGTWLKVWGRDEIWRYPTNHSAIMASSLFRSPLANGTTMMNKGLLIKNNLYYDESFKVASDSDFFNRCKKCFALASLDEVLYYYRQHEGQITNRYRNKKSYFGDRIRTKKLHDLGLSPNPREIEIYRALTYRKFDFSREFIEDANKFMLDIKRKNDEVKLYPEPEISIVLGKKWFDVCNASRSLGIWTWKYFWDSPLSRYAVLSRRTKVTFTLKCLLRYSKH